MYLIIHVVEEVEDKYSVTDYGVFTNYDEALEIVNDLNKDARDDKLPDRWKIFKEVQE